MSKVYFYYSCMESGKSASCLINIHQYRKNGIEPLILAPPQANGVITTRLGKIDEEAITITNDSLPSDYINNNTEVIIIDEVQFLSKEAIEDLFKIAIYKNIKVICYGLLTDFKTELFEGSKRLIELGAKLQLIKSVGSLGEIPVVNARYSNGKIVTTGDVISVNKETYKPMTLREYWTETQIR